MIKYLWLRSKLLHLPLLSGVLLSLFVTLSGTSISYAHRHVGITVALCDQVHLQSALTKAAAKDTITFQCSGTIVLTHTLAITKNLTLAAGSGQNVTLDGNNLVQVLLVSSGVHFVLNAMTIAHGRATNANGGGLANYGEVDIHHSTFKNNSATYGGGIWNTDTGTLNISNSTFIKNSAKRGADLYNDGGEVTVSNITAPNHGNGFYNDGGSVTSRNSSSTGDSSGTNDDGDSDNSDNSDDAQPTPTATKH